MSEPRTVIVTGATGGIGSEITDRFLANGDVVLATGLSEDELADWRRRWDQSAPDGYCAPLHTAVVDISSEASVSALAERARAISPSVEVLVNNAGTFPQARFEDMTTEQWRRVIDIDLTGTFLVIKAVLPLLDRTGRGRIVKVGSGTFWDGTPSMAHYAAAKGGVLGLTRVLSRELGTYGITTNLVTPGLTPTPAATAVVDDSLWEQQRRARGLQRDETPGDAVGAVFFVASADAAFMTGQTVNVDGGSTFV